MRMRIVINQSGERVVLSCDIIKMIAAITTVLAKNVKILINMTLMAIKKIIMESLLQL